MRTAEQNKVYMSQYMSKKYAQDIEASRAKSRDNYYRNKHSCYNQERRIHKHIEALQKDISLLINSNEKCSNELSRISYKLMTIVESINEELGLGDI